MSRTKPWLPNATPMIAGGIGFDLNAAAVKRIGDVLGAPLQELGANKLGEICSDYIAQRQVELDAPLASDALGQVEAVEKATAALRDALQALSTGAAAHRLDRVFGYALREVYIQDLRSGVTARPTFLDEMLAAAAVLSRATAIVGQKLNVNTETTKEAPNYAWKQLILALGRFAEDQGMKIGARGDSGDHGKASPFVSFVSEVQAALPKEYRRGQASIGALSAEISKALKGRNGKPRPVCC